MGETEMLPPEIPETTLGNHEQGRQQELPGGKKKKKKKWILKKYEVSEAVAPVQVTWVRTQHLPGLWPTSVHPLPKSIPPPRGHQSAFLQCVVSGFRQIFTGLID